MQFTSRVLQVLRSSLIAKIKKRPSVAALFNKSAAYTATEDELR